MTEAEAPLKAFLCHASEDDGLAERLARALQGARIDTFCDDWSIRTGESLRARIDHGLEGCTHFVVLLTPASIGKPWVNAEIDAAFVLKVNGQCKFLPVRYNLPVDRLPPLLAAMYAPEITDATYEVDVRRLIGDIYGVTRKPALGRAPDYVTAPVRRRSGLSVGSEKVAHLMATRSQRGRPRDPKLQVDEILEATSLTIEELEVAVDELESKGLVKAVRAVGCRPLGYYAVEAREQLFLTLDPVFMDWRPRDDAVRLAAELVNSGRHWLPIGETAERLGWAPRRVNPALSYLIRQRAVLPSKSLDPVFVSTQVARNNRTARFLRDRQ